MDKNMIVIENNDGTTLEVEVVTYLISDDKTTNYLVYSKGEISGDEGDEVIYISRIVNKDGKIMIEEIKDDTEWSNVQLLLKKIANS